MSQVAARVRAHLDGDAALLADVRRHLALQGIDLAPASDAPAAEVLVVRRPGGELVPVVRDASASASGRVLVVCAPGAPGHPLSAWSLLHAGAADVVTWPAERAGDVGAAVAARLRRWSEVDAAVASPAVGGQLVGSSARWRAAVRELVEVALTADAPVLLTGESGTGKELAARLLHELDRRRDKRSLVVLDCTTIVPTLSGSEFFGHERGAFTDAVAAREGAFGAADGGTLFLDELGELPSTLQAELLRVIQEGMYKRVGSSTWRQTRFRLVAATNRDLREEVASGRFRRDLYHRVAAWSIHLPPLRERTEDIPALAAHFLRELRPDLAEHGFSEPVLQVLGRREYPGNVRELRHLVSRLAARHVGPGPITVGDLPASEWPAGGGEEEAWRGDEWARCIRRALVRNVPLREIGRAAEDTAIALAMEEACGNVRRASLLLGVTDRALQMRRAAARRAGGLSQ